jgi:hypothetical protein
MEILKPLFFWNPAWYLWLNEFHCLQEYACDEALLARPGVQPRNYGLCLLEVATAAGGARPWAASNMVPHFALWRSARSQLQRRIRMLEQSRSETLVQTRVGGYALFLLAGLALTCASVLPVNGAVEDRAYLPIEVVQPSYPREALRQKMIGWVQVRLDVTESGAVAREAVVEHCAIPAEFDPAAVPQEGGCLENSAIFDAAALAAIRDFRFEPRIVDGVAVATPGVQYVFRFSLNEQDPPLDELLEQYGVPFPQRPQQR